MATKALTHPSHRQHQIFNCKAVTVHESCRFPDLNPACLFIICPAHSCKDFSPEALKAMVLIGALSSKEKLSA